jgi:hypothetical protein
MKVWNPFRKPSVEVLAQQNLDEAKRELLKQQSLAEYHKHMVNYCQERVKNLSKTLGAQDD